MKRNTKALRARVEIEFSPQAARLYDVLAAQLPASAYQPSERVRAELVVAATHQRLTLEPEGRGATTFVLQPGRRVSVWDHELSAFADLDEPLPRTKIPPGAPVVMESVEKGKRNRAIARVKTALGEVRWEIDGSSDARLAPFAEGLLGALHCSLSCHEHSGLPFAELAQVGAVVEERAYLDGASEPFMRLQVSGQELVEVNASTWKPPRRFRPMARVFRDSESERKMPGAEPFDPPAEKAPGTAFALRKLDIEEKLTPDCLGSTRFGSMTATVHQDLLDHLRSGLAQAMPALGTATIAGGTLTLPWLATLAATGPMAPGSGLFSFLRDPRVAPTAAVAGSGGRGLLDLLAVRALRERNSSGRTFLEQAFADGTLATRIAAWGLPAALDTALTAAGGSLDQLPVADQVAIAEAYETRELGVLTIGGLPSAFGPVNFRNLMGVGVTGLTGTMNFAAIGGPAVTSLRFGSQGDLNATVALPPVTLRGTLTRSLTFLGWVALIGGSAALCALFPLLCPLAVTLAMLVAFLVNNVTALTVTATGVTLAINVAYRFNNSTNRLEPVVTITSTGGAISVVNTWVTPNLIANLFESFLTTVGNLFNAWLPVLVDQLPPMLTQALVDSGATFPPAAAEMGVEAVSGQASSQADAMLMLSVNLAPVAAVASQPFTTQVQTNRAMEDFLEKAHFDIRRELNPQPATPPPLAPLDVIQAGTYFGLALSQNALNYSLFTRWRNGEFNRVYTDPQFLSRLLRRAPANAFVRSFHQVHVWPATPPRVELAPNAVAKDGPPLVVYFDDFRACFELNLDNRQVGSWELCFNFKAAATLTLDWPLLTRLAVDLRTYAVSEFASWEFVDPNVPGVMAQFAPRDWAGVAEMLALDLLAPLNSASVTRPSAAQPWNRPLPAIQQNLLDPLVVPLLRPQQFYVEMMTRRKALFLLPVFDTTLLELVDGSGAPALNLLTGAGAAGTISLRTMNRAEGITLRSLLPFAEFRLP